MRVEEQEYLDFSNVLLKPKRSKLASRSEVDLNRDFAFPHAKRSWSGIPIIAANMDTVATIEAANVLSKNSMGTALHKHFTIDELVDYFSLYRDCVFYTLGTSDDDMTKFDAFRKRAGYLPNICIDVANGYSEAFIDFCKRFRDKIGDKAIVMAGNVATPEIVEELLLNAVDIVKIGIGSGAQCMTRYVTGVGVPQLTSVMDCADAAHGVKGTICSDGGITSPGDVMKAFGAGADFVMIGSAFAGHDESGGDLVYDKDMNIIGRTTYGMSSGTAMKKYHNGVAKYRSSEGRTSTVPYRGSLQETIDYYLGGLRSGMTYIGASRIKEVSKRATFIKVRNVLNETYRETTQSIR